MGRRVIDLGPGDAYAINERGQVVGSTSSFGGFRAFLFDENGLRLLGEVAEDAAGCAPFDPALRTSEDARRGSGAETGAIMHPETPVEALMTRQPVTVMTSDGVEEAMALLERYPFRHLPVVEMNRLVGMVSDRDLALATALPRGRRAPGRGARARRLVAEIMRAPVISVAPSTSARAAVELMLEHRIGALPVVSDGALLGIVTETDVLRLLERCDLCSDSGARTAARVEACMKRSVQTATCDDDLLEAAGRLHDSGVRHLPVVMGGKLVGMVSDRDVRRGVARLVREDRRAETAGSARVPRLRVEDMMSTPCLTVQAERPLRAAASMMLKNHIGALVVCQGERTVGIITQTDLLEHYRDWGPLTS